jgi:hypothetical protein
LTLGIAIASLQWLTEGCGDMKLQRSMSGAYDYAMKAAEIRGGRNKMEAAFINETRSWRVRTLPA